MLRVDRDYTAELETMVFGGNRILYTTQVSGPPQMTLWLLKTRAQLIPEWQPSETRLITSMKVQHWLDLFSQRRVDQLYLLAPREDQWTLTMCRRADRQVHDSGEESLLLLLDEARVTVADAPPTGQVVQTKEVWQTTAEKRRQAERA